MRLKFIVIVVIAVAIGFLVQQMMRIERNIREHREVTLFISDHDIPLIEKAGPRILREKAIASNYTCRCNGDHFEYQVPVAGEGPVSFAWQPVFLKGVNLGVAMPGHFPADFSLTGDQYYYWLTRMAEMNANSVRTYTILPPEFYLAFSRYNRDHADRPLYLFQGVWAIPPAGDDFLGGDYINALKREIRNAVDVIHGNATLPDRPGHAHGIYAADVSSWVGGFILGREWEPMSVTYTNLSHQEHSYQGDFVSVFSATPTEVFLATLLDFTVLYETQEYSWQHPVSFVNWLTLDPMYHNSEFIEGANIREFDNDLEAIDIRKFHASDLFAPGIFSSYHVYPYYPDFIYFDRKYQGRPEGHYAAYLDELKVYHPGIPLVIAEYGIPSSRGNSHKTPQGCDQGGHSEAEQANINAKLTREIWNSGAAGAFYFEWFDEWFKHNWLVMDFEVPAENCVNWHNMDNPEQNFGIIALGGRERIIDGKPDDWPQHDVIMFHVDADYFYIALNLGKIDFSTEDIYIGLDTYDGELGDHQLPFGTRSERGFEFLASFRGDDDALLQVDEPYDLYTDVLRDLGPPYTTEKNDNGIFVDQKFLSNRIQVSLTNDTMPPWEFDSSILHIGNSDDPATSNADWNYDPETGFLEMRFTWLSLNFGDPSSRQVFNDDKETFGIETVETPAVYLKVYVTDKQGNLASTFPSRGYHSASWDKWQQPQYTARRKLLFDTLASCFADLGIPRDLPHMTAGDGATVAGFYQNKPGAVSVVIDGNLFWYPELARGVLRKYDIPVAFGFENRTLEKEPADITDFNGHREKRMGPEQLSLVREYGHEMIFLPHEREGMEASKTRYELITGTPVCCALTAPGLTTSNLGAYEFVLGGNEKRVIWLSSPSALSPARFDEELGQRRGMHTIIVFPGIDQKEESDSTFGLTSFEQFLRIARNQGYWMAPPSEVQRYQRSREAVSLHLETMGNTSFLKAELKRTLQDAHPLTIIFRTSSRKVRITNSLTDGIHEVRNGMIMFDMMPGSQVIIENLGS